MTERFTVKDVRIAYQGYAELLESLGYDTLLMQLQEGSATYGRAFRVTVDGYEAPGTGNSGYIGFTAREAYDTLWTIRRTLAFAQGLAR